MTADGSAPENETPFRVIAYVTPNIVIQSIPYERLTHINYAFLLPKADGTFKPIVNGWKLEKMVEEAHKHDVEVLISVGGWGWDEEFETLAADAESRARFVADLKDFVDRYQLDGADVDWEYPAPGESAANYLRLMQEVRAAMPNKLVTTAVVAYGANGDGVPQESFEVFDFVNVMAYDGPDHGTLAQYTAGVDYWQKRGLPADKMVMGLPFYSRPNYSPYSKLVKSEPEAAYSDLIELNGLAHHYNGIPTIQQKTEIALEKGGGVMFWTLDFDAPGEPSLVGAIDEIVSR